MNGLDDGTLLDRWREHRDGEAFAELARRHSTVVYDITCRVLGDRAGAEDVLQEALLSLALEPTRKPADVGVVAWLARFAICRARNRRASERSRARRQIVVGKRRPEESMPDDGLALNDELEHALAGCEPADRAILAMRFLHGWDYDRIASALSIHEGAARVRVHRALQAVRAKVARNETSPVAPALAALPVAALPFARIDAAIRSAVEIAKVQLGAPPNGVEHATAATHSFRVAVTLSGAALLFVGAAGATLVRDTDPSATASAREVAVVDGAAPYGRVVADAPFRGLRPATVDEAYRGTPRPPGWDHGMLGRSGGDAGDTAVAAPASSAAPAASDPAPAQPQAADADRALEPPDASRPIHRGARAAKGETDSSEGERAGAPGSSAGTGAPAPGAGAAPAPAVWTEQRAAAADDAERAAETADAADEADEAPTEPRGQDVASPDTTDTPRRRAERPTATLDALPEDTRALVGAAEEAVRQLLADQGADLSTDDAKAVRRGIRSVQKKYAKLHRGAAAPASAPKVQRAKRAAVVREILSLLAQTVLADGRVAGDLRWPAGADVEAALAEVIRVLSARADAPTQDVPAGALPAGASW